MKSILLFADPMYMQNKIFAAGNCHAKVRDCLREKGIKLDTVDQGRIKTCDALLFFDLSAKRFLDLPRLVNEFGKSKKFILTIWEPVVITPASWDKNLHKFFDKIITWDDRLVDNKKYFKMNYPQSLLPFLGNKISFQQKKLCTMIAANKMYEHPDELYSERLHAIQFFMKNAQKDFDLYGYNWEKFSLPLTCYKGSVRDKGEVFSKYRFAICYENTKNAQGYITEKIFDCFSGGAIPVYWGADNITDFIPDNTFIDRRKFANYYELLYYLQSITEAEYNQYIQNIKKFLQSEAYKQFTIDYYVTNMVRLLSDL